ncbi:hypothetical protein [Sphingomonas flavescens]|uniref:hypothetical protein n=1 Tax=Sphingomonas flavescens TaxID=3132797 RepID=UPI0028052AA1|nr:hypothetical protein [Sphingomonas limnosediminicola]
MAIEAKPFASLSSGLLARKGAARPAMRPQGFGQVGAGLEDLGWNDMGFEAPKPAVAPRDESHDAFGEVVDHPRAHSLGLTPVESPVHHQQAEIVERIYDANDGDDVADETAELYEPKSVEAVPAAEAKPVTEPVVQPVVQPVVVPIAKPAAFRAPRTRAAPGSKGKAAFTLRLDPERHLKLRLACAVGGRSAQQLVTDALDQLLERMPELDGLAAKANRRG